MKVVLLKEDGYCGYRPRRAHFDDAGIDFFAPKDYVVPAHGSVLINLMVCVEIPIGYYGKMESKSGLMTKKGVVCAGGVIDSGFRGSIKVRMENHEDTDYKFDQGDKVVQMVLIPCLLEDCEVVPVLNDSVSGRGTSGWGSTGR